MVSIDFLEDLEILSHNLEMEKFCKQFPLALSHVEALGKIQNYSYKNPRIALLALIHRSTLVHWPGDKKGIISNEKLEFFGDAFLDFIITVELMKHYPQQQEGELSQLRAAIVGTENLAQKSLDLNLATLMFHEGKIGHQFNFLADSFESITAALAIDGGFEVAKTWLLNIFSKDLMKYSLNTFALDAKGQFQSWVQRVIPCVPIYKTNTEGTPKSPLFEIIVSVCDVEIARAQGLNKREASRNAAKKALDLIKNGAISAQDILSYYKRKA